MKKTILTFLFLVICVSLLACNSVSITEEMDEEFDAIDETSAVFDTGEKELNADSILDYIEFDIKLENVVGWYTQSEDGTTSSGFERCDVNLNVFAKKPVEFDDVKKVFTFVSFGKEITVSYPDFEIKEDTENWHKLSTISTPINIKHNN